MNLGSLVLAADIFAENLLYREVNVNGFESLTLGAKVVAPLLIITVLSITKHAINKFYTHKE